MNPEVMITKGTIPPIPVFITEEDIAGLAVELLGVETLWGLICVQHAAEGEDVIITARHASEAEPVAYDPMRAVAEWHEAVGEKFFIELADGDRRDLMRLRQKLIGEEWAEVDDEILSFVYGEDTFTGQPPSRERLAVELADLLYVVYGTADLMEIPLYKVFKLVHEKNLEKIDPETGKVKKREDGKILKPEGFQPLTEEDVRAVIE